MNTKTNKVLTAITAATILGALYTAWSTIAPQKDDVQSNEVVVVSPAEGGPIRIYTQGEYEHGYKDHVQRISTTVQQRGFQAQGFTKDAYPLKISASVDFGVNPKEINKYIQSRSPQAWMGDLDDSLSASLKSFISITPAHKLIRPTEKVNEDLAAHLRQMLKDKGITTHAAFIKGHYAKDGEKMPDEQNILKEAENSIEAQAESEKINQPIIVTIKGQGENPTVSEFFYEKDKCAEPEKTKESADENKKINLDSKSEIKAPRKVKPKSCKG